MSVSKAQVLFGFCSGFVNFFQSSDFLLSLSLPLSFVCSLSVHFFHMKRRISSFSNLEVYRKCDTNKWDLETSFFLAGPFFLSFSLPLFSPFHLPYTFYLFLVSSPGIVSKCELLKVPSNSDCSFGSEASRVNKCQNVTNYQLLGHNGRGKMEVGEKEERNGRTVD